MSNPAGNELSGFSEPELAEITALVEQALADLRAGKPVIVADSRNREDEADFIMSAETTTVEWIAWGIRHSSGFLCAPMTGSRADDLDLPLMVPQSQDPRRTAYTVSVDAAVGVTTGISAADRHRTLQVLANPEASAADIIRPGHVLPLRAVPGGVLHRPGHTEAAVDLCRIAGLTPVAAIAELVNDDGTMMRQGDASKLAEREGLVFLTIAELIAYRKAIGDQAPPQAPAPFRVVREGVAQLPTKFGDFQIYSYRDARTGDSHVAIVQPKLTGVPVVRVHSECLTGDAFGSLRCDCGPQLEEALTRISATGGAVIYLRGHEGRGIGISAKVQAYALQDEGLDTVDANVALGLPVDRREYGAAAAILADLEWTEVHLLSNNPAKAEGLRASGITVTGVEGWYVSRNEHNENYLQTKVSRMGHMEENK